jgi:hypothetical protein
MSVRLKYLRHTFAIAVLLLLAAGAAHAKRVALVVGNDSYQNVAVLQKARNDADAMERELRFAGFRVAKYKDVGYLDLVDAMSAFYASIDRGDEVVVFFAGHGVQTKNGSYLIPTDVKVATEAQIEQRSIELNRILESLKDAGAAFSLVLIDACRDNPLKSGAGSLTAARGLSPPDPPSGQMVVFSASKNQQALDELGANDKNPNGVFTREFIARMRQPGLSVDKLVREVEVSVERLAAGINHKQQPARYNKAREDFYFVAGAAASGSNQALALPGNAPLNEAQREDRFWEDTKSAGNRDGFEAYLDQYPGGRYAKLAQANIARLGGVASNASPTLVAANSPAPAPSNIATQAPTARPTSPVPVSSQANANPAIGTAATAPASPAPIAVVAALETPRDKAFTRSTLPNGDRYEGEAIGITRVGKGTYVFASGDRYEGEFLDNFFHGKGTQTYANGEVYTGDFQKSVKTGQGNYRYTNGDRYEGGFVDNVFQGKGMQVFSSGDSFEGEFRAGTKQGPGTYRFANGDRFDGNFVDNLFNGRGVMAFANGDRYEGDFLNSAKNGQGTHFFASKDRFEGSFVAGVQSGLGTHFYANGDKYVGQFANGVRHGKGVYSFANGQVKELEFVNGAEKTN